MINKEEIIKTSIITDPIHKVMYLGNHSLRYCLKSVMDTEAFQRLRRISQVGLTSYVFPGATHTRFSHSLGTAYLAYVVLMHLLEQAGQKKDKEMVQEIEASLLEVGMAALLHDIGHGPFSHSFEQVLKGLIENPPMHEDWTAAMITSESSEICQVLKKHKLDVERIGSVFSARYDSNPFPYYLKQIVSSQLDVDRMDYLIRDSHFAGVEIGRFDLRYLIHSLVVANFDGIKTLGITPKGVKPYETFTFARQMMNRTVYFHHNVKVLEYMLEQLFRIVLNHLDQLHEYEEISPHLPPYFSSLQLFVDGASNKMEKHKFIQDNLDNYIAFTEDRAWSLISVLAKADVARTELNVVWQLANRLLKRQTLRHYPVLDEKGGPLKERLLRSEYEENKDFALIILPTVMYRGTNSDSVFVVDWNGDVKPVLTFSDIISSQTDRPAKETILVIVDEDKEQNIRQIACNMRAIPARTETTRMSMLE